MCPSRIECPNGYSFRLKVGEELNKASKHFDKLPDEDKQDLTEWKSLWGTRRGYKIAIWGLQDTFYFVSSKKITSSPIGHEQDIQLGEGNVHILRGGTKVIPLKQKTQERGPQSKK